RELRLNEALRAAGLILLDEKGKPTAWTAYAWNNGGSAAIVLRDPNDAAARRAVGDVLARLAALEDSPIQRVLDGPAAQAAGAFQSGARAPARARNVQVGHEGEPARPGLLVPERRVLAHLGQEPLPELRRRLDHAAAQEVRARVREVRRDREEPADRHGL